MNVEEISLEDKEYPEMLKKIKNPPIKIYVKGNKKILNDKAIAIVGSRDCTEKGKENARMFSINLAKAGFTIVSGMAKGIDSASHIGAIDVCGKTIAVLGCGINYVYPKENEEIYKKIIETGGAIVSEYQDMIEPDSEKFRNRNRIVSGLSLGILVVEAELRSGTSITARYAKEQNRDVFCIPNAIENKKGIGTNKLIQKGAKLVIEPNDIIEKYTGCKLKQITIEDIENKNKIDLSNIKEEYREICKVIQEESLGINDISKKVNLDISELYQRLLLMELEDIIEIKQNKYVIKGVK